MLKKTNEWSVSAVNKGECRGKDHNIGLQQRDISKRVWTNNSRGSSVWCSSNGKCYNNKWSGRKEWPCNSGVVRRWCYSSRNDAMNWRWMQ